ncbi:MAG: radical SAM protein, partial [Deltaproteobacteria bacterium]|nr:radical SAM protein [Deltaproteobacteria bacterium]
MSLNEAPDHRDIILCGFEPLLAPDLPARIKSVLRHGSRVVALVTNGRLFNYDRTVRAMANLGVGHVVVKLFGHDAIGHDAHTGVDGSFEQALSGVRKLRGAGVRVSI